MKRIYTILMSLVLLSTALPLQAQTTVYYLDSKGEVKQTTATALTSVTSGDSLVVSGDVYVAEPIRIKMPIIVKGDVKLILCDGAQMYAMGCIAVEGSNSLTITAGNLTETIAGVGQLIVTDEYNAYKGGKVDADSAHAADGDNARIGSRREQQCGTIIINGGNVNARSTYNENIGLNHSTRVMGADIGSGKLGSDGYIEINGGNVRCPAVVSKVDGNLSIMEGACIGSGQDATGTVKIYINGGDVYACAVDMDSVRTNARYFDLVEYGAAIGTGDSSKGNAIIEIHGGNVTAYAARGFSTSDLQAHGAGIGTGEDYQSDSTTTITITGGNVTAYSTYGGEEGYGGAGIGMGNSWDGPGKVDITISGGKVTACGASGPTEGSGIGGGADGGCGNITIMGGAIVNAFNCDPTYSTETKAPGIGDGAKDGTGTLSIYGDACEVNTWGKYGIGNSNEGTFIACGYPSDSVIQVISGDSYDMPNNNSPQYWEPTKDFNIDIKYGESKWRKIIFGKRDLYTQKTVYYLDSDGKVQSCVAKRLSGGIIKGNYFVDSTTTVINEALIVADTANIIVLDGVLTKAKGCIVVENDNMLIVSAGNTSADIAGTGQLIVTDEYNAAVGGTADEDGEWANDGDNARIGSREGQKCGNIIINGGNVTAYSTYTDNIAFDLPHVMGADIGSGYKGSDGYIEINGGNVTCKGATGVYVDDLTKMYAAAIGSGYLSTGTSNIVINNGHVKACAFHNTRAREREVCGAAIGTGYKASGNAKIVINNGTVEAYAGINTTSKAAGIGTGEDYASDLTTTIIINGGNVTAYGARYDSLYIDDNISYGAGIGMGDDWEEGKGKVDITITGGTVFACGATYESYASGIGGGENGGCGTINISGAANVTAWSCDPYQGKISDSEYAPGIGDGKADVGGSLYINGNYCTVETWGKYGIGNTESGNFQAYVWPDSDIPYLVYSGDSKYQKDNNNSPEKYSITINAAYGTSMWRKVTFVTDPVASVYYTKADGEVAGPVEAHVYQHWVETLGSETSADTTY